MSLDRDISYWKSKLDSASKRIELPLDRPRSLTPSYSSAAHSIFLSTEFCEQISELANQERVPEFNVLLTVFVLLLARYSRQEDFVIGAAQLSTNSPGKDTFGGISPLHCELTAEPTFCQLLRSLTTGLVDSRSHAVGFETLVNALGQDNIQNRNPIFQVLFAAQDHAAAVDWPRGTDKLDLAVMVHGEGSPAKVEFRYNADIFDAATVARLSSSFLVLLKSALADPERNGFTLPLLGEAERHTILVEWNQTAIEYPRDVLLHQLFEQQVERTPDAIAVISGSQQLTYRELNQRANQLANRLQKLGVGPDILVAVCAERSLEIVIALLGSMKAGGAYVPLDPEYPRDRLLTMLEDSCPPAILTQAHLLDRLPQVNIPIICLDKDLASMSSESGSNPSVAMTGKNIAYCIYTSGSTGKPKGVPNVHESIVNRLLWGQDTYHLTPYDRVVQKTPFSFDVSVWEFFWPLITGATLVMARPGGHKDPAYLIELIKDKRITTSHFVPSMLAIFLTAEGVEQCRSLRHVFTSGEALPFELQCRFFERLPIKLHNLYGPTETAVEVTYWECNANYARAVVPIGKPVANTQAYILDAHLQPAPIGVAGELHIGGVQLARGYLNRPELTAEKFIPDPFSQNADARLYKTGDLARFLPDGNIEYLGRIDNQVKLRGFRIELGEIEAVLCECPGVGLAAVTVREDVPGDKRLVSYLVRIPGADFSLESIKAHLSEKLPEFMVPSRFVVLDHMPMTTSGKVDRRALPKPQDLRGESREIVAARNDLESAILPLFEKVLGVSSLGIQDDFFELGGHSLLAAQLVSEIKRVTGRQLPLSAMLRASTVENLAQVIASEVEAPADSVVMPIQPGSAGSIPIFAAVIPGVETLGYAALARHLGPRQSFYALQRKETIPGAPPFLRAEVEELAREYIAAMRSVQSEGPYFFIAMCDDVALTEEMVLQLETAGYDVGFFAILDTWAGQNTMVRWKWKIDYYRTRLHQTMQLPISDWPKTARGILARKFKTSVQLPASRVRPTWGQIYWPDPGFKPPVFRAPVILFKRPRQPFFYVKDPKMGWGQRSLAGVETHAMKLDHENLLREPHIKAIGKILAARLQIATRSQKGVGLLSSVRTPVARS